MSLVLEALRKQQAASDPTAAVALALVTEQRRRQRTWIVLLAMALLLNAAVFAWLFRDRLIGLPEPAAPVAGQAAAPEPTTIVTETPPGATPALPLAADQAQAAAPLDASQAGATAAVTPAPLPGPAAAVAAAPAPLPPPARVIERIAFEDLPAGPRSRFPGIAFSTHIYAEDPALRAIVANGQRLQEGDRVADLLIREIAENGIVLEFEDYLVEVPVFTDW